MEGQTHQKAPRPNRPDSTYGHLTLPQFAAARSTSGPVYQASTTASEDGGAPALHPDLSSDVALTGIHDPFAPTMFPSGEQTPEDFFASSNGPFLDFSPFENHTVDPLSDELGYIDSSPASSVNPRYLDASVSQINSVPSHKPGPEPWSHVGIIGSSSLLPGTMNSDQAGISPRYLTTPVAANRPSSASGRQTFADSAYATGSKKSLHASEVESLGEQHSDTMDPRRINMSAAPHPSEHTSSHTSTITPTPHTHGQDSIHTGQPPERRSQRGRSELDCDGCDYRAKTRSDLKKHSARHQRTYKCRLQECPRSNNGFATVNDLDRHMKTVHKVNTKNSRSYKCFGQGCTKPDKEWPRLDNFKQHLSKMHKDENMQYLLERSKEWYDQKPMQSPLDETASIGTVEQPIPFNTPMSLRENFDVFRAPLLSSTSSYPSAPSGGSDMTRSLSHGASVSPVAIDPRLGFPTGNQSYPIQSHSNMLHPQSHVSSQYNNKSHLQIPPQAIFNRSRSHADTSAYQDGPQVQHDFTANYVLTPNTNFDPFATIQQDFSGTRLWTDQPGRRVKKARTDAGPDSHLQRKADLDAFKDPKPFPQDHNGNSEEFLTFIGSNPGARNVPDDLPQPSPVHDSADHALRSVESSPTSPLHKRLVDEVNAVLAKVKPHSDDSSLSYEELVKQFHSNLGGLESVTSCGAESVDTPSKSAGTKNQSGIRCPKTKQTYFVCPVCKKVKNRQSELKKHMQRHSKPYGCVFDKCHKPFGSKNDWTRHERKQHEQPECWRCHLCYEVFPHDQSLYTKHMAHAHKIANSEEHAQRSRVARNYQGRFWCGFCAEIIVHNRSDVDSHTVRFDHIAEHFTKEQKASKDWIELTGGGKTKRQLLREQGQTTPEEEDADDILGGSSDAIDSTSQIESHPQRREAHQSSQHDEARSQILQHDELPRSTLAGDNDNTHVQHPRYASEEQVPHRNGQTVTCCSCGSMQIPSHGKICINPECLHPLTRCCSWAYGTLDIDPFQG